MADDHVKITIEEAIRAFANGNLTENALKLFQTLGYDTVRQAPLSEAVFSEFKENYISPEKSFSESKALCREWKYVDLLFQLTKEEILKQTSLFDTKQVDNTIIETYLFFAIELSGEQYTRTALSDITREVNKLFPMPVMILFKHGNTLTLSVINRRLHKRDATKDVLEKVTQIKDIRIPIKQDEIIHRAHIEILFDLSLDELKRKHNFTNFVELHNAWQKTLDIKELNKQFYQKLFNWYLWALQEVRFPQIRPDSDKIEDKVHQSESLIRLLTRLLFVWFMKEKGLINMDLFNENKLQSILANFQGTKGSETIYYKAILQNLFFATLNKPIDQRKVIDKGFNPKEYGDPLVYRFDELFAEPENVLEYFENIPFLNGGLFECLDQKKDSENPVEIRIDGFSVVKSKQVNLPDKYFFGEYRNIDLSKDYDDKKKSKLTVYGIIDILNHYKFTIEESTPIDEEIALDPELLGKVFENLLASYNPETQTTARKQTGSFYTPREIVSYMVDESLIAYLKNNINDEDRLRELFSYNDKTDTNPFNASETKTLVSAIDKCKILDPACGSGAFPMGVLQKLTYILHKLDPENQIWFDMVISNLPTYMQTEARKRLEKEDWNYVRKLGVIQQCIYGIDIQPIATQIAKLRFFISLLVDQKEKPDEPNLGFEPLPNLDFKIVTANTLISAPENEAIEAYAKDAVQDFEKLTTEYFSAVAEDKEKIRKKIKSCTQEIVNANQRVINQWIDKIKRESNSATPAKKKQMQKQREQFQQDLDLWSTFPNIYKHEPIGFFETKYFFPQVKDGFDVVIGNPPFVEAKKLKGISQKLRKFYSTYSGTADLFVYFYENGIRNLNDNGTLVFITSNKFIKTSYGENLRKYFTGFRINEIIDFTDVHVFEALVSSCIFSISKCQELDNRIKVAYADDSLTDFSSITAFIEQNSFYLAQETLSEKIWQLENENLLSIKEIIESDSVTLNQTGSIKIFRGVTTGYNPAFIIGEERREELLKADKGNGEIIKPLLQGRDIRKWQYKKSSNYLIFTRRGTNIRDFPFIEEHLKHFKQYLEPGIGRKPGSYQWYEIQDNTAYYKEFEKEKIIWGLTADKWVFAYDNRKYFLPSNGYILTSSDLPINYLLILMNSKLMEFYFRFIGIMTAGGAYTLKFETVMEFPIKNIGIKIQPKFVCIATLILNLKKQNKDSSFFERLANAMVYELFLPEVIKSGDCEVLKHLSYLSEMQDEWDDEKKLEVIEQVYEELSDPNHPVSVAMFKMDTIEEIRIIEGKQ